MTDVSQRLDLIDKVIVAIGDNVIKQKKELEQVRASNTELVRRAFGFPPYSTALPSFGQPVLTPPTDITRKQNEEIVRGLQAKTLENCCSFYYSVIFGGHKLHFKGSFVHHNDGKVVCANSATELSTYPRSKALFSMLHDRCFGGVEAFAVACENALGADVDEVVLAGKIVPDVDVTLLNEALHGRK
jgi:hypothetical protein